MSFPEEGTKLGWRVVLERILKAVLKTYGGVVNEGPSYCVCSVEGTAERVTLTGTVVRVHRSALVNVVVGRE